MKLSCETPAQSRGETLRLHAGNELSATERMRFDVCGALRRVNFSPLSNQPPCPQRGFRIPIPDNAKAKSFVLHFLLRDNFIAASLARRRNELLSPHSKNLFRAFNIAVNEIKYR